MPTYAYRYVVYLDDSELSGAQGSRPASDQAGPDELDPALRAAVDEVLSYCAPLHPTLISLTRVPLAGTDLTRYLYDSLGIAKDKANPECWRVEFGGTVQADTRTGEGDAWDTSAEGVVEEGSYEGVSRGWETSFAQFLTVDEPERITTPHTPAAQDEAAQQHP